MTYKKKLIEVALPLEAINVASAREKSIRHGHPSTMHLWWARRPLAAARAVIFAQMVDDPSEHPDIFKTEKAQEKERQRLFRIIEELVKWESTTNESVLKQARDEIWQSWRYSCAENADHPKAKELFDRHRLPAFHDPFAGGGALPLEAQRLGMESYASDLNPVAVLINKSMIEVPVRFASKPPVNLIWQNKSADEKSMTTDWKGAKGLAEDIRYYGQWMRDEGEKRIGHLYPKIKITKDMVDERPDLQPYLGQQLKVIAWLWARTVNSPNPAFSNVAVPLASTFMLSTKVGKEAYVEPILEGQSYRFKVNFGKPKNAEDAKRGTKSGTSGSSFLCLMSGTSMPFEYLRNEAKSSRMGQRLMAIVAEGIRGRIYLSPTAEHEAIALSEQPKDPPETDLPAKALGFRVQEYGMTKWQDLFTSRQLVALTTFTGLVGEAIEQIKEDAVKAGFADDKLSFNDGGKGSTAYAEAVGVYLAFGVNRTAHSVCSFVKWNNARDQSNVVFSRQALPMLWDFADVNPFAGAAGDLSISCDGVAKGLAATDVISVAGFSVQADASTQSVSQGKVISTDPPYYDNIGYADLSDFFYVWLRRSLRTIFPDLFSTLAVPKAEELVATPFRHGSKEKAEIFFLDGMTHAMHRLAEQAHPAFPVTIYYAFKQSESDDLQGTTNTGWDTFLAAVIEAGFSISGTWPMRTEREGRPVGNGTNSLASSIVLVCRRRLDTAPTATLREFINALKSELPAALSYLQAGNIAPVDLAQAAIGPGMAVYTRYSKVLDADGKALSVRAALSLINQTLDEALAEQEGDFDADTRWALTWFEQVGFAEGDFGTANTLAQAKNTGMDGLAAAGIIVSGKGKVRLLLPAELAPTWDPTADKRLTVWEMLHQLIRALESNGEGAASLLVAKLGSKSETARELCYRLYTLCERRKRASEAMSYNGLVQSWPEITRLANEESSTVKVGTTDMFEQE
jgi:putative DNA methylase